MQYNIVELLDENLKPTGNRRYLHSTEIMPVIAKTREEEMKAQICGLQKTIRQLLNGDSEKDKDNKKTSKTETAEPEKVGEFGDAPHYFSSAGGRD